MAVYMKSWRRKDRWKRYIVKPLGLCHYCYGTWIAIFTYISFVGLDIAIFIIFGVNYIATKIIDSYDRQNIYYINNTEEEDSRTTIKGFGK